MSLTHFSLFSGIGGIDLAAEWAGFETVGQCEIADYPIKVLEKHFPKVPKWRDIRDVTADSFRERTGLQELTLLSGGFPCQPHSLAGKRLASADERDLWGEFARTIREIRPKWVLGENVRGLLSSENGQFFGRILRDFSEMGYDVRWCVYGAVNVGAPHKRDRVFIIAWNTNDVNEQTQQRVCRGANADTARICTDVSHSYSKRKLQQEGSIKDFGGWAGDDCKDVPNANSLRMEGARSEQQTTGSSRACENVSDTNNPRLQIARQEPEYKAIYGENGIEHDSWWATEPDVGRVAHGIPTRVDRLKCLGNAVVPQQAYPILKAIADIERSTTQNTPSQSR